MTYSIGIGIIISAGGFGIETLCKKKKTDMIDYL